METGVCVHLSDIKNVGAISEPCFPSHTSSILHRGLVFGLFLNSKFLLPFHLLFLQRTNAKGAKEVAADFEKRQVSIEQQINAL